MKWSYIIFFAGAAILLAAGAAGAGVGSNIVLRISNAIAIAERGAAELASGRIRFNNPGDLTDPNTGDFLIFDTIQSGWEALYNQVSAILNGTSPLYPGGGNLTITQVAKIYVGTPDYLNWAHNVSAVLGVSPDTPLNQV